MADWISFFDSEHSIYVNARHRDVHASVVAEGILSYMPSPAGNVLDYGCGEALYAERIAASVDRLILCEAAPHLREALAARVAGNAKISVLAPEDLAKLTEASCDLIVIHSVLQYLTPAQADSLFRLFRRLLRQGGCLIIGDVVQPDVSAFSDALALIRLGAANGFLIAAVFGLLRTLFSDYWRLRQSMGLTRYGETAMIEKLAAAGFSAVRAPRNIGHIRARMTFLARAA